jgi:O-antigen ligase
MARNAMSTPRQTTTWGPRALALAALCGPIWPTSFVLQQASVGRLLLVAIALGIAVDLVPVRGRIARPAWAMAALMAALGALAGWTVLNGLLFGCLCSGAAQGFAELVVLIGLAGLVGLYAPQRWLLVIVGAAVAGAVAGGLLALVGLRDLHAAVYRPSDSVSRLEGVYGNPNSLGYALGLALPASAAVVVRVPGWRRWVALAVAALLGGLLFATYSRGSLLAATAGVAVAIAVALPRRPPRSVLIAVGIGVPLLAGAFVVSPFYKSKRLEADFGASHVQNADAIDRSGWSTPAVGPVRLPGARLSNPPGSTDLVVRALRAGQGAAYSLGDAFGDGRSTWGFSVVAAGTATPVTVGWAVADDLGATMDSGLVRAGRRARTVSARFGSRLARRYVTFVWSETPGAFRMSDVHVTERRTGEPGTSVRPVPTRLLGSSAGVLAEHERDYEGSRRAALRMALEAFAAHPVQGLGLQQFHDYAAEHGRFGELATHNTYTQVLSELGLIGALLLLVALAVIAISLWRGRPPPLLGAMLAGTLATGMVNLVFINGLAAPGMAMPLILAVGFAVAWAGEPPSWWPQRLARVPRRRDKAGV